MAFAERPVGEVQRDDRANGGQAKLTLLLEGLDDVLELLRNNKSFVSSRSRRNEHRA